MTTAPDGVDPLVLTQGSVAFDGEDVFAALNLTVTQGEFLAVLGENGTGKTTLMRALLGLVPLTSGELRLYGRPVSKFRDWQRMAYVPQRLLAAGTVPVSVEEVVRSAWISPRHRFRRPGQAGRTAVETALRTVGLWHRRSERFDALSGGQQRRVMIARALSAGADTFVLDEPTAGVDAENQHRLAHTLADIKESGRTVLLVTHELGPVSDLATRVLVLGRAATGSVLYDGPAPPPRHLSHDIAHHDDDEPWSLDRARRLMEPPLLEDL